MNFFLQVSDETVQITSEHDKSQAFKGKFSIELTPDRSGIVIFSELMVDMCCSGNLERVYFISLNLFNYFRQFGIMCCLQNNIYFFVCEYLSCHYNTK